MATPHTVGLIGVILQARPDLKPGEVERLLQRTARKIGPDYIADPQHPGSTVHFAYGAGLADTVNALEELGITKAGLPAAGVETTIIDGDVDDGGAGDVVKLTMQDVNVGGVTGITHRMTVGNGASVLGSGNSYTIVRNVNGQHFETTVVANAAEMAAAEPAENNNAVASSVSLAGDVISAFVPYNQMGFPEFGSPIHNIRVITGSDFAPSPEGGNPVTDAVQSMYGKAFTVLQEPGLPPASDEKSCELPGFTMVTSPSGLTGNGTNTGQDDLRKIWVAEPTEQPGKLVFTMKVDNLNPQPTAGYRWYVYFKVPGDTADYFVNMDTTAGAPTFNYGTRGALPSTPVGAVGTFETIGPIDDTSNFNTDGTITMVLDKATLGITKGMAIDGIAGSIRQTSNPANGSGLTVDSAAASGPYVIVGNDVCASPDINIAPTPAVGTGGDCGGTSANCSGGGSLGWLILLPMLGFALRRRFR